MKHIFYIQSNISFLVAKGTIQKLSLAPGNCIFLYGRNFFPEKLPDILLNKRVDEWGIPIKVWFWKSWKVLENVQRKIDAFIEDEVGESYVLYTSSFIYYSISYLKKHQNCQSINFLEEGSGAYYNFEEKRRIIRQKKYDLRLYVIHLFYILNHKFKFTFILPHEYIRIFNQCESIFIVDNRAFTFTGVKKIVVPFIFDTNTLSQDIKYLIVPSSHAELKIVRKKDYLEVLAEVITEFIESGIKQVHIKFHPYVSKHKNLNDYRQLIRSFEKQIDIVELPFSLQTEDVLFQSKAHVYTDTSSVAIYAQKMGCKITSYSDKIIERDKRFSKYTSTQPKVIQKILCLENEGK
jgi:hypothetical protein